MRLRFAFIALSALAAACAAPRTEAAQAKAGDDDVVTLPPYEVNGVRPWLYAEIPGYQVLSLASEKQTRAILERMQRATRFTPLFFPEGVETRFTAPCTLFVQHFAGDETVKEAGRRMRLPYKPGGLWTGPKDAMTWLPTSEATKSWLDDRGTILGSHLYGVCGLVAPLMPVWYRESFNQLFDRAQIEGTTVEIRAPRWDTDDLMPIEEALAVTSREHFKRVLDGGREAKARFTSRATIFVHWGLFGDVGSRRETFLKFLAEACRGPIDEAVFQRHFGIGFVEADSVLVNYARTDARERVTLRLPADLAMAPFPPVLVRPATLGEVARVVGESYLNLGNSTFPDESMHYAASARTTLMSAYEADDRDPRLLAVLGTLEFYEKNDDKAREYFEAAVAGNVARPTAYVTLAILRLRALQRSVPRGVAFSDAQSEEVLSLVRAADSMQPRLAAALTISLETRMRGATVPPDEELARIDAEARNFPHDPRVLLTAARFLWMCRRDAAARELLDLALGCNLDDSAHESTLQAIRSLRSTLERKTARPPSFGMPAQDFLSPTLPASGSPVPESPPGR